MSNKNKKLLKVIEHSVEEKRAVNSKLKEKSYKLKKSQWCLFITIIIFRSEAHKFHTLQPWIFLNLPIDWRLRLNTPLCLLEFNSENQETNNCYRFGDICLK